MHPVLTVEPNLSSSQIIEERRGFAPIAYYPLPRAVTRHNFYELLDGEWKFDLDPDDRGIAEGWHIHHEYPRTATWPGSIEKLRLIPNASDPSLAASPVSATARLLIRRI